MLEILHRAFHACGVDHGGHDHRSALQGGAGRPSSAPWQRPGRRSARAAITVAVAAAMSAVSQRGHRRRAVARHRSVEWVDDENLMDAVTRPPVPVGPIFSCSPKNWRVPASSGLPQISRPGWPLRRRRSANCLRRSEAPFRDAAPELHLPRRHHGRGAEVLMGRTACSRC